MVLAVIVQKAFAPVHQRQVRISLDVVPTLVVRPLDIVHDVVHVVSVEAPVVESPVVQEA